MPLDVLWSYSEIKMTEQLNTLEFFVSVEQAAALAVNISGIVQRGSQADKKFHLV